VYGDDPLTIFGGKVTEVTDKAVVIELGTRVTLPVGFDASRVSVDSRVLVRARRIRASAELTALRRVCRMLDSNMAGQARRKTTT
jgi:hypothetical protein